MRVDVSATMLVMRALFVVGVLSCWACTEKNPLFCASDSECATTARPICDITGEFEGTANVCIATPADCSIERCGCTPGEGLSCDGDQLTTCAADGRSSVISTCALGCSTEGRCLTFEPSNGLGAAFAMSNAEAEVVLPTGARIDTTDGTVQDAEGNIIPVTSIVIDQDGTTSINAFVARSWILDDVKVTGSRAIAFVAFESISIRSVVDASADGILGGPGGQENPAVCVGGGTLQDPPECPTLGCRAVGGGGGGNADLGAAGGGFTAAGGAGGAKIPGFVPLSGGCRGGSLGPTFPRTGGAGGGAVQLVAGKVVTFSSAGAIDVGGGGGEQTTGGGSGGNIVIESPSIMFNGSSTGAFANGGSGGGCGLVGVDGRRDVFAAIGPRCGAASPGDGGTAMALPTAGQIKCPTGTCAVINDHQGGGGASVGKLLAVTRDGELSLVGSPTMSAIISKATLVPN